MARAAQDELRLLAEWTAALDPSSPLDFSKPEQKARYVSFDPWIGSDSQRFELRGNLCQNTVSTIELASVSSNPNSTQLVSGFRGTGKSTELARIRATLQADPRFAVLSFDAHDYLSLGSSPTAEEFALALAAGLSEAAQSFQVVARALQGKTIWQVLGDFLNREVKELSFGALGLNLKVLLKESADFRTQLTQALRHRPDVLRGFLHNFVEQIADALSPLQVVLLVDGLDKFNAPSERIVSIYRETADLFFDRSELLRLPRCHVVYVVTPHLGFMHKGLANLYGRLQVLPSIKVRDRPSVGGAIYEPGVRALEEILSRRVDLDRLFGSGRPECIESLVLASGGHIRDLFNLVREVLRASVSMSLPASLSSVQQAIESIGGDRGPILRETAELLSQVQLSEGLSSVSSGQLGTLAAAMDQYLILGYQNGTAWFGIHPLIAPALEEALRGIERLSAGRPNA